MAKTTPTTLAGRVIARLEQIETWFREGLKHQEVVERLGKEGIKIHPDHLRQILTTFGVTERKIRRTLGRAQDAGPDRPRVKSRTNGPRRPVGEQPVAKTEPTVQKGAGQRDKEESRPAVNPRTAELIEKQTTGRQRLSVNASHTKEDVIG